MDAEAMEDGAYWPAPHGSLSQISYNTKNHQPRSGNVHSKLGPSTSVINKKKYTGHFGGVILLIEFSSSKMMTTCVKST